MKTRYTFLAILLVFVTKRAGINLPTLASPFASIIVEFPRENGDRDLLYRPGALEKASHMLATMIPIYCGDRSGTFWSPWIRRPLEVPSPATRRASNKINIERRVHRVRLPLPFPFPSLGSFDATSPCSLREDSVSRLGKPSFIFLVSLTKSVLTTRRHRQLQLLVAAFTLKPAL